MKILKLLNKIKLIILIFFIFSNSIANEPADIWNIDKTEIEKKENTQDDNLLSEEISEEVISVYDLNNQNNEDNQNKVLLENNLESKNTLYGLYDPDQNNLSIEMWGTSDGNEIKKIFDKIFSQDLSNDALDILEVALLTNSNTPELNISQEEFYDFQNKLSQYNV